MYTENVCLMKENPLLLKDLLKPYRIEFIDT